MTRPPRPAFGAWWADADLVAARSRAARCAMSASARSPLHDQTGPRAGGFALGAVPAGAEGLHPVGPWRRVRRDAAPRLSRATGRGPEPRRVGHVSRHRSDGRLAVRDRRAATLCGVRAPAAPGVQPGRVAPPSPWGQEWYPPAARFRRHGGQRGSGHDQAPYRAGPRPLTLAVRCARTLRRSRTPPRRGSGCHFPRSPAPRTCSTCCPS